jgi:single-stranded-DNA-specific exonuclease
LRTINGFHLHRALAACATHLDAWGGHAAAAGLTVAVDRFAAFRTDFAAQAAAHAQAGSEGDESWAPADVAAELGDLDLAQVEELARLAPFGNGNGEPLVALSGLTVRSSRVVGQNHLQLSVSRGEVVLDGIGFGMASAAPAEGSRIDALACPEVDDYRGYRRARLRFKRVAAAAP